MRAATSSAHMYMHMHMDMCMHMVCVSDCMCVWLWAVPMRVGMRPDRSCGSREVLLRRTSALFLNSDRSVIGERGMRLTGGVGTGERREFLLVYFACPCVSTLLFRV